jgi:hypothetical protein
MAPDYRFEIKNAYYTFEDIQQITLESTQNPKTHLMKNFSSTNLQLPLTTISRSTLDAKNTNCNNKSNHIHNRRLSQWLTDDIREECTMAIKSKRNTQSHCSKIKATTTATATKAPAAMDTKIKDRARK